MCDHYQYSKKVKKPGERQVQSIHSNKYILKEKKKLSIKGLEVSIEEILNIIVKIVYKVIGV